MLNTDIKNSPDMRLLLLENWLSQYQAKWSIQLETLVPASSDASFRRYFRLNTSNPLHQSLIVMDAPPEREKIEPFIRIAHLFLKAGLQVPHILEEDLAQGFILLSDLGNRTYLAELNKNTASGLYQDASNALIQLQLASKPSTLPHYDSNLFQREMDLFPEWYLKQHLRIALSELERSELQKIFDLLIQNHLAETQVYVHRDFHSRNLMMLEKNNPGILDFQDAVYGPLSYDLVSLWRDAYIVWTESEVLDWLISYWEKARKAGIKVPNDFGDFYKDFEWMGLQRHLKILGIFARLYHRDGKEAYLQDLPTVLKYALDVANRYRDFKVLAKLLERSQAMLQAALPKSDRS